MVTLDGKQNTLRLYGCGGCGTNIALHFDKGENEKQSAIISPTYLDTSRSNLLAAGVAKEDRCFLLEGLDGSGKIRRDNHDAIAKNVKKMLDTFPPQDFNLVIFSASGGSGSVIGPLIVSELLNRKLPVVALVVGSRESAITIQNTINTLKSLESIAQRMDLPVVMFYRENDRATPQSAVDKACVRLIGGLAILTSGRNSGMDSRDLLNWVQFNRHTGVKACLATVDMFLKPEEANEVENPIAVASLYNSPDLHDLTSTPDYHTAGYPTEEAEYAASTHFIIDTDCVTEIYSQIQKHMSEIDSRRNARVVHDSIVSNKDNVSDTGLIL